ncbi:hypothetical protein RhiirC2_763179 [Rhizophagus irregularis]|uniref:Uncharacterized protein n=1 Tax=Rhizophagus irregularis TaxID=588596 RepID=A0A2N1MAR5_9GLOM|nr:hypothetical protein RhiirC2_763179 [Rhizophagus irregularis]
MQHHTQKNQRKGLRTIKSKEKRKDLYFSFGRLNLPPVNTVIGGMVHTILIVVLWYKI